MNLSSMLQERAAAGQPIRIGQVGAGKFGTMFLSQVRLTTGMHLAGLADLMPARAGSACRGRLANGADRGESVADAFKTGGTFVTDDAMALIANPEIDVVIEATGDPADRHQLCQAAIAHGKHIVMVNVEADALAGPLLARQAREAGVVYSLAWGDQPALICEQVDWARACGFKVVAAGKGTRYHPSYHQSTPDTVWDILDQYLHDPGSQPHQPQDVRLVHRRHQVGHRDDRRVQCHGAGAAVRRPGFPHRHASSWRTYANPRARVALWRRRA